ncbi:ABC transporter ATP-binding protein [Leptolyngbya sp. FACHB-261]|uniref:ABC transporter ATP-binding protein n=1 Tax=Leptolyngbya sp. FACHB-261 TaxID=2692806 RepID=UPI00168A0BAD|nr:ABC transporter ATP-binding protein [Leptolyngbya sp. FACHB-261]MBD2100369.1 ABC transporter ATP-binding protein [Leptolyngbya sp. FACHB-261]
MQLEVRQLYKQFKTRLNPLAVLRDINLHIAEGELVCAVGASGSGKSTLLRLIAGLDTPTAGEIRVDGVSVAGPGPDRGMVFQSYTLYPWMTVAENVGFGLKLQGAPSTLRRQQIAYYLEVVGLSQFAQALPRELSGGMKQRVAIARALASQPKILLMDEPFGALDVQTKEAMQQFLLHVWRQTSTTIFMITHDVEEAVFLSQRLYVLTSRPGSIKAEFSFDWPAERTYQIKRSSRFLETKENVMDLLRAETEEAVLVH